MLDIKTKNVNVRVIATLVIVAHLEKCPVGGEILLQGLESSTVERELEVAILETHLVMESAAWRDTSNLVQVLALASFRSIRNADGNLAIPIVVDFGLFLLEL